MIDRLMLLLSLLSFVLLAVLLLDARKRPAAAYRVLSLGRRKIPAVWVRRGWMAALVLSFAAGLYGLPLGEHTNVREGESTDAPIGAETRSVLRLPFLVRESRIATSVDGTFRRSVRTSRAQIPLAFGLIVLLYGWRVVGPGAAGASKETSPLSPPTAGTGGRR